jgi:hypothetical protein
VVRTVIVGPGTTPTFSWTPACLAGSVIVLRAAPVGDRPAGTVWSVTSESGIAPGLRYGVTPSGATVTHAAEPLTSGVLHSVNVIVDPCPPGASHCGNSSSIGDGVATFTP